MTADCLFCRIASGEIPVERVGETSRVIAIRDLQPQAPTHLLLIPREHVASSAADLSADHAALLGDLFALAARLAKREGLEGGWRLVSNVGEEGGQSVAHLHVHLLGGRRMNWPPG